MGSIKASCSEIIVRPEVLKIGIGESFSAIYYFESVSNSSFHESDYSSGIIATEFISEFYKAATSTAFSWLVVD